MMIKLTKIYLVSLLFFFINCKNSEEKKEKVYKKEISENTAQKKVNNQTIIRELNPNEIQRLINNEFKKNVNFIGHIKKVFEYKDRLGLNYLITIQDINENNKSQAIQFLVVRKDKDSFKEVNRIKDFVLKEGNDVSEEYNIFIWHKYLTVKDINSDGLVDLILVYGTKGENGFEDGRVKQIIIYKGEKVVFRHQNASLDDERVTKIDNSFFELPVSLRKEVFNKMNSMVNDGLANFNYDVIENVRKSIKVKN